MRDTQELATQPSATSQRTDRSAEYPLIPPADVLEDTDGITLYIDMPGVSKDGLKVEADKNTLVIEGELQFSLPSGMEAVYAELQSTRYRRSFTLSGELDAERTIANLKNGVLSVNIPLRAEVRPRKIEVHAT
jgi:HSP20 family molecular chaperone IbpA